MVYGKNKETYLNVERDISVMARFSVIVEQGEDGYLISEVVGLPGCHTQAKTYDQLLKRTKEAIVLYMKTKALNSPMPKFVGLQQLEVEI